MEELLQHLMLHPGLVKGVGLGVRSKETIDRQWNDLAARLNAHGDGATKTGQRWKRYWADLKFKTKTIAAARRREASGTGGGPATLDELSEVDKKVLAIIGEGAVYGDRQHRVPVFIPSTQSIMEIQPSISNRPLTGTVNVEIEGSAIDFHNEVEINTTARTDSQPLPAALSPSTGGQTSRVSYTTDAATVPGSPQHLALSRRIIEESPPRSVPSPSIRGQTSRVNITEATAAPPRRPVTSRAAPGSPRRPATSRRMFDSPVSRHQHRHSSGSVTRAVRINQRIEPQWIIDLENRRVDAESRLAEAAVISAEAARMQAESARLQAEASKIQAEAMRDHSTLLAKLVNILANK